MNIRFEDKALEELYAKGHTSDKFYNKLPKDIIKRYIKVVNIMNDNLVPFIATHPGELLKDELQERGISQKQLSVMTGIKPSAISETIHGKRSVSKNMAVALEKALGISAEMWMNLQTQYDLDSANIVERDIQLETIPVTIPIRDHNLLKEISRKFGWACTI